jgi:hypothetical protein
MAATVTLSVQPERTDAHVGLIGEWRVFDLAVELGLRSKLRMGYG